MRLKTIQPLYVLIACSVHVVHEQCRVWPGSDLNSLGLIAVTFACHGLRLHQPGATLDDS